MLLKWLFLKKKFIGYLPLTKPKKRQLLNRIKLKQITLRSNLQESASKELFGKYAFGIAFNTENGILLNTFNDVQVSSSLGRLGSYNLQELKVLLNLIRYSDVVYIIGTHIGSLLVPIAKKSKSVVGFEANPSTFEFLSVNIAANSIRNTNVYNYAVYNSKTTLSFYQNKANSGGSKIKPIIDDYKYNYDNPSVIEVEGDSLDNLVEQFHLSLPDFIIMDIEGAEYFALLGANKCLENVSVLYIEFVPHHLKNISNVSIETFCSLITKYFSVMKLIDEEINNENKNYVNLAISERLNELYNQDKSADLLLFKNTFINANA